jgi:hypothetical protein
MLLIARLKPVWAGHAGEQHVFAGPVQLFPGRWFSYALKLRWSKWER